jgi:ubiquinone biosynthesis protein UbiJ
MAKVQVKLLLEPEEAQALRQRAVAESRTLGELVSDVLGLATPKEDLSSVKRNVEMLFKSFEMLDQRLKRLEQGKPLVARAVDELRNSW